jgi:hypothetical protein
MGDTSFLKFQRVYTVPGRLVNPLFRVFSGTFSKGFEGDAIPPIPFNPPAVHELSVNFPQRCTPPGKYAMMPLYEICWKEGIYVLFD